MWPKFINNTQRRLGNLGYLAFSPELGFEKQKERVRVVDKNSGLTTQNQIRAGGVWRGEDLS